MNVFGKQIIFADLLERHQRIQIPILQRDYAQGRATEREQQIREEFLNDLHRAVLLPPEHESLPLNLDFIYGSVEGDTKTRFLPLDGQQRLTTLFLLHWYLSWKDGLRDEFCEMFCVDGVSRFSYRVRPSSEEFFNALVNFPLLSFPSDVESLIKLITDQPWYFRHWRLDPTIQSSLTMLQAIHERFRDSDDCFTRLVDTEKPAITFQLLDLKNFGLSDDLYIKMNARGKPLTAFEAFKARYEQVLAHQFAGETRTIDNQSFPVAEFFARRMDTQWADFFWSHRDKETNLYDKAVMNLFRAVALMTRDPVSDSYVDDVSSLRSRQVKSTYSDFHSKGWLDRSLADSLFILLETWSKKRGEFVIQLPDARFFDEVKQFKKATTEPTNLGYIEIVQFAAYIVFLREHVDAVDSGAFQEWMRVVFNLSTNTSYDRLSDMQRSIEGIFELAPNCGSILEYFSTTEKPTAGFSGQQISEEKLKAELILLDHGWRPLIDQAEGHGYFRGQIEFLLDFCGAREKWMTSSVIDWGNDVHAFLQKEFRNYLSKAELMFNARGLADLGEHRWERALLSIGDYLLPGGRQNHSFLVNSSTDQASWKRLLRGTGTKVREARRLLYELWNNLETDGDIDDQLEAIIHAGTNVEPWRQALVQTPKAIEYCERRFIRWISEDVVYLLKKSQMNGTHAELFTFCLFQNQFLDMATEGELKPLELQVYESAIGTDVEPGIRFLWSHDGRSVYFDFERSEQGYIIFVDCDSLRLLSDANGILVDMAGFQENESRWERVINPTDVQTPLVELARALATATKEGPVHA